MIAILIKSNTALLFILPDLPFYDHSHQKGKRESKPFIKESIYLAKAWNFTVPLFFYFNSHLDHPVQLPKMDPATPKFRSRLLSWLCRSRPGTSNFTSFTYVLPLVAFLNNVEFIMLSFGVIWWNLDLNLWNFTWV